MYSGYNQDKIYILNSKKGVIFDVNTLKFEACKISWEAQGKLLNAGRKAFTSEMQWDKSEPKIIMEDFIITGKGSYIQINSN